VVAAGDRDHLVLVQPLDTQVGGQMILHADVEIDFDPIR